MNPPAITIRLQEIGGGNGTLIAAILKTAPKLRGVVLDSPSGSAEASRQLEVNSLSERCEVIAGDFFSSVPRNGDAYILKSIIHNWDDERSVTILRNCREAISADGKLLLIERVMAARIDACSAISDGQCPTCTCSSRSVVASGPRMSIKHFLRRLNSS
jgi:O-methyltransferase domain